MSQEQLRDDMLNRIKDRHFVWWNDSMELYKMAGLKPSAFGHDATIVLTYQLCWMLEHYELDLDDFIKILRSSMKAYQQVKK